jgi:hypothetical protein
MPSVDANVLDGSAVMNMLKPGNARTFDDCASKAFMPYICFQLASVKRLDIVWDRYDPAGLKAITRDKRGTGSRRQVTSSFPEPHIWHDFLRNDKNKKELLCFLARKICVDTVNVGGKLVVSTLEIGIVSSSTNYDSLLLQPCSHEEADTRMLLHAADQARARYSKIILRTVDTDVVVLAVAFCQQLHCDE